MESLPAITNRNLMKLTDPLASPIIQRSFDLDLLRSWGKKGELCRLHSNSRPT